MIESKAKADLRRYLQTTREALLWRLDGLSEYDIRRPLTPTGTNLLGLTKHVSGVELGYFGDTFGRPFFDEAAPPWFGDDAEPNADMWATADESRETDRRAVSPGVDALRHHDHHDDARRDRPRAMVARNDVR